jgi:hypothetical protein
MQKQNFNKSIRDKELKILEYYKRKGKIEKASTDKPVNQLIRKRTKKQLLAKHTPTPDIHSKENEKLTKTVKLPILETPKPKVVEMD